MLFHPLQIKQGWISSCEINVSEQSFFFKIILSEKTKAEDKSKRVTDKKDVVDVKEEGDDKDDDDDDDNEEEEDGKNSNVNKSVACYHLKKNTL